MASDISLSDGSVLTADDLQLIADEVKKLIAKGSKDPSQYEAVSTLENLTTLPALRQAGPIFSLVRVPVALLKGQDAKTVELRATSEALEWRQEGGDWQTLLTLDALRDLLTDQMMGYKQVILTQEEYDALDAKDAKTFYFIVED